MRNKRRTSGNVPLEKTIKRQVWKDGGEQDVEDSEEAMRTFPQAPSPTMTSFLLISDMISIGLGAVQSWRRPHHTTI